MNSRARNITALVFAVAAIGVILLIIFANFDKADEALNEETAYIPADVEAVLPEFSASTVASISLKDMSTGAELVVERQFDQDEGGAITEPGAWELKTAPDDDLTHILDQEQIDLGLLNLTDLIPTSTFEDVDDLSEFGLGESQGLLLTLKDNEGMQFVLQFGSMNVDGTDYYAILPDSSDVTLLSSYQIEPIVTFLTVPPFMDDLIEAMDTEG